MSDNAMVYKRVKVRQFRKQTMVTQDSEFCSFFGRIEETIVCFRDCLTFSDNVSQISRENEGE